MNNLIFLLIIFLLLFLICYIMDKEEIKKYAHTKYKRLNKK